MRVSKRHHLNLMLIVAKLPIFGKRILKHIEIDKLLNQNQVKQAEL